MLDFSNSVFQYSSLSLTLEMKKPFIFFIFLLCFLLFTSSFIDVVIAKPVFCDRKCKKRCSKAGVKDRCIKYCGICCGFCKCVPSGTYGNKHECPCYRDMRSSKGRPKCP